jgi:hypothetical protein
MNVLLTTTGGRNQLVSFFKKALDRHGQVIVCDSKESAPALLEAHQRLIVPPMDRPDYFDALLDICREQRVRLVFSVNDLELGGLARHALRFRAAANDPGRGVARDHRDLPGSSHEGLQRRVSASCQPCFRSDPAWEGSFRGSRTHLKGYQELRQFSWMSLELAFILP